MTSLDLNEYNGTSLVATAITFLTLSWISVLLRIYVRAFMTRFFQLDDWFMLIAQVRAHSFPGSLTIAPGAA